jgi:hypothetical protein
LQSFEELVQEAPAAATAEEEEVEEETRKKKKPRVGTPPFATGGAPDMHMTQKFAQILIAVSSEFVGMMQESGVAL